MSEVAGRLAPQIGAHFLERGNGGRGVLLGGAPGVRPGRVVVIGAGTVGTNAAWIAQGMEAEVILIDRDLDRLRVVDQIHRGRIMTLASSQAVVERSMRDADLVIGAVLVPGGRAPVVATEEMVPGHGAGVGHRRRRRRPGWVHRDDGRDHPRAPRGGAPRGAPLRRGEHPRRGPPHLDLRAHQRHVSLRARPSPTTVCAARSRSDPALGRGRAVRVGTAHQRGRGRGPGPTRRGSARGLAVACR